MEQCANSESKHLTGIIELLNFIAFIMDSELEQKLVQLFHVN